MGWWSPQKPASSGTEQSKPDAVNNNASVMTEVVVAGTKADAASSSLKSFQPSSSSSSSTSAFFTRSRKPAPLDDAAVAEGALVPRSSQDAGLVSGTDNAPVLDDGAESLARSQVNSFQNQLHVKIDWIAAIAAYGFGSAMHVHGQSTGLCTLSMWLAGNAFIMNSQYRGVYGPTSDAFRYESMASWIWMLASFQQFRQTKVLKYAGFSSWTGFGCVAYFSTRHLTNMVTMPAAA